MKICNYNDHPPPNSLQTCNKNNLTKCLQNDIKNKKLSSSIFLQKEKENIVCMKQLSKFTYSFKLLRHVYRHEK